MDQMSIVEMKIMIKDEEVHEMNASLALLVDRDSDLFKSLGFKVLTPAVK